MKLHNLSSMILAAAMLVLAPDGAMADNFGTGANQFTLDFVPISGATNPTSGYGIVNHDYHMGTYEITNDQWNKFASSLGVPVTGTSSQYVYARSSYFTGAKQPTDDVSWFEAAQFVNWLNTSTGHQAAYKFTGTQGTNNYTFVDWSPTDAGYDSTNPYRNKEAYYFLPTENEWVKAAYWSGTALQTYATIGDVLPVQGNGSSGTGWNFYDAGWATNPYGPWNVGSGSQELNGTYDMMGNNVEWMENPWTSGDYDAGSSRAARGGDWNISCPAADSNNHYERTPTLENQLIGFRVASIPEPGSITLLAAGAIAGLIGWRRWR